MTVTQMVKKLEGGIYTEEELAEIAAEVLNLGSMPVEAYIKFKETLSDDNWTELEQRIENGD